MSESHKTVQRKTAFALEGLAGNNAHGAGFLQAALKTGKKPDLISCTSGQIYWVYNYINEMNQSTTSSKKQEPSKVEHDHLRMILQEDIQSTSKGPLGMINQMLWGRPGKIEPDLIHYSNELVMNSWGLVLKSISHPTDINPISDMMNLLPSQWLAPKFSEDFYEKISACFNDEHTISIFFNSYNPVGGIETVHVNAAAKQAISFRNTENTHYESITPRALKDALKLYDYGFDSTIGENLDGAYIRPVILRELLSADDIFVVKPCNSTWIGALPKTKPELEDMKTEIGINAIYRAEKANIELINKLIMKGYLKDVDTYHTVTLHEVEIPVNRGFFDYTTENLSVFDTATNMGTRMLTQAM